ncbi:ABC transporter ATP-binding protein [Paracoccus aerodenitrificans]|uniref:ABC transporter ATP-binding protein n=1 Tax=Paracoccus aerodenitrificans TaxID=3017781 RepID=UPI0022EFEB1E|nr:ABC transporter ATP-binding protein [Paracoccus aerodenitrificans]WBU62714.1 ABC transporter ATP-binding protein [Paracoccus aerodenitrificans]
MPEPGSHALSLEGIGCRFGDRQVLADISMEAPAGRITCLLGESGCGKSTLLRVIAGIEHPSAGHILMDGSEIAGPARFVEPEQRNIGFMFQDYALFPHLSIRDNLAFGLRGIPAEQRQQRIDEVIAKIGIAHLEGRFPYSLSGGEQQRVALARALAPRPAVLLMDEPFSNLDQGLREYVRRETLATLRELGITAIIVTHDPQEALAMGEHIVLMKQGRIEQQGSPFDIYDRPVSVYAAEFMGPCNRLPGIWTGRGIETPIGYFPASLDLDEGDLALACIRPQALTIEPGSEGIAARVVSKTFMGESEQIELSVHPLADTLRMHSHQRVKMAVGEKVRLRLNGAQIHVFAENSLSDQRFVPKNS